MVLPDFLIVGAQKSGTTTLYDILSSHPEVNMSSTKEINFFTSEKKMAKGLNHYSSYFTAMKEGQKISGEASPGYMNNKHVPKLIKDNLGDIKVVMILRNPVKRAYSQYWDNRRHLSEPLNENQIVDAYLSDTYSVNSKGYFSRGVYIKHIEEYLKNFERDKIHIIIFEELVENPEFILKNLFHFLEIDSSKELLKLKKKSNPSTIWGNPLYTFLLNNPGYTKLLPKRMRRFFFFGKETPYKYPLASDEKLRKLQEFYEPWNKELALFLNKNLDHWNIF